MRVSTNVKKLILYFKEKIFSGEYCSGDKLPSIRALAKDLGAKPGAIRQCFEILASDDPVEIIHGSGTYVKHKEQIKDNCKEKNITFQF
ncbi:MAG: winged helix-turn-helix transcriptional regulator [Lentisphaerae bacterium]|nr:winged helix-turn-helix transcriptional regulator [Lentisphaerota bacterium]MCP4100171.1 winged helix-turn-helix transcriptional regulator [Lentisphaerota bacterium]